MKNISNALRLIKFSFLFPFHSIQNTKYTLESFCEKRQTCWAFEPYLGGPIDPPSSSSESSNVWEIDLKPNEKFQNQTHQMEVPHTGSIKMCHCCGGIGRKRCYSCNGTGSVWMILLMILVTKCDFSIPNRNHVIHAMELGTNMDFMVQMEEIWNWVEKHVSIAMELEKRDAGNAMVMEWLNAGSVLELDKSNASLNLWLHGKIIMITNLFYITH